jgi:Pvc16 N-terminal domain
MANESALLSLAESLARRLDNAYTPALRGLHGEVSFQAIGSGGLLADLGAQGAVLSVWPYRVTVNEQMRNLSAADARRTPGLSNRPLALDVHLLLSVWTANTATELGVFAWVLRELHREAILDASTLSSNGGWAADEVVQLIPAELTVEDMMRIWEAIAPGYRLSAPYVARIVQLDVEQPDGLPVLARRFDYGGVPL